MSSTQVNVQKPASMLELDGHVIAPMFGFSCASEYYRSASSGPYLSRVRRPTLVVHCANDPIVAGHLIRGDDFVSGEASDFLVSHDSRGRTLDGHQ